MNSPIPYLSAPTITRVILILAIFVFSESVTADEYDSANSNTSGKTAQLKIESIDFGISPQILRETLVRAILNYNWEIKTVTKNQVIAENKNAVLTAKIVDNSVITLSLKPASGSSANVKWLKSIEKFLNREYQYYHYTQQLNSLSN